MNIATTIVGDKDGHRFLSVMGLSKSFLAINSGLRVLSDLTFQVAKGEFAVIVGPSGCGKTTLLKLIGGLMTADSGAIEILGKGPSHMRERQEIGFVFQNPVLLPWRTVLGNVLLPAEILRHRNRSGRQLSKAQWRADAQKMIDLMGLQGFEDAYPDQLSGGMKSRAAIARVLSYRPSILLMDEPFGDLDEITRLRLNIEMLKIHARAGVTILFVTHSIREAVFLADKIVVMSPRPSSVTEVLTVPLSRPRELEMQESAAFGHCMRKLRHALGFSCAEGGDGRR